MRLGVLAVFAGLLVGSPAVATQPKPSSQPIYNLGDAGVSAPVKVTLVWPKYPLSAIQAGTKGVVDLQCGVLSGGTVGDVTITGGSSDPALRKAAIDAAKQWTFKAGQKEGHSVPVSEPIEMTFTKR